jgi:predicted DNA-binding mobile mystery protein A
MNADRTARQRLDERFRGMRGLIGPRPNAGWIRAIRDALGMSGPDLARRMGITAQSLSSIEQNEVSGSLRLDTLRRAAEVLDADLVYAIVPRRDLEEMVQTQAEYMAGRMLLPIAHHSRLENQSVDSEWERQQLLEVAQSLVDKRGLWTDGRAL